jgi:hypothetical protein
VNTVAVGTRRAHQRLGNSPEASMEEAKAHEYDCIVCGAHFDNSQDLSRHNEQVHLKNAQGMERPREDDDREHERAETD